MSDGPHSLAALSHDWDRPEAPWHPPVFISAEVWPAVIGAGVEPGGRCVPCANARCTLFRAAASAWARAVAGAGTGVTAVVPSAALDERTLARLRLVAGERLQVVAVGAQAPEALPVGGRWTRLPDNTAGSEPPATRRPWPPVALASLAAGGAEVMAATSPDGDPATDAGLALQALATAEPGVLDPRGDPRWQPADGASLIALAQLAAEGYRPVATRWPGPEASEELVAIGRAGLPLVAVTVLDDAEAAAAAGLPGWWFGEAADRRALHAMLVTALEADAPWLIRLPEAWIPDLPPPGEDWEPGAGRLVAGDDAAEAWILCTAATVAAGRRLVRAAEGRRVGLVQAASLRPLPWQVRHGPCGTLDVPGGGLLAACAEADGLSVTRLDATAEPRSVLDAWLGVAP